MVDNKIYILTSGEYEDYILGVFSDYKKAEIAQKKIIDLKIKNNKCDNENNFVLQDEIKNINIEEYIIDELEKDPISKRLRIKQNDYF